MNIGHIIQFHRKKAGLSRIDLAHLAGLGKTLIYELEHGKLTVSFDKLMSICKVLNIKLIFTSPYIEEFEDNDES
jgi:HTH-type transcriptional regulator / antitoxin HipB